MTAERIAEVGECRCMTSTALSQGSVPANMAGNDREVLRHVVGDREGRQRAARHQQLLADRDDLDQLGRVAVEVDHVAGFLGRLRARVHRQPDVGLRQRRRVVGAVAHHRDEFAVGLLLAQIGELLLGRRLGDVVVDPRLGGDGLGGERIVAGDHHRAQAHQPQLRHPLLDVRLEDILERHDAGDRRVLGDDQGRRPAAADLGDDARQLRGRDAASGLRHSAGSRRARLCES